jgi:uncharacterized protein YbaR (Trm112 family)
LALSADVLQVVVDPVDRQPLHYFESENILYNERARKKYLIGQADIAVLLPDEGVSVSDAEHDRLMQCIGDGQSIATGPGTGAKEEE